MNELMTGLQCRCGHDYACHAPAPHAGCGECDCAISRADIAEQGGRLLAAALAERDALRETLLDIEALADRDKQRHDGVRVFVEALLPDILVLARDALQGGDPS